MKLHKGVEVRCTTAQDHGLEHALDNKLIELSRDAIDHGKEVEIDLPILNINRTVGTMLSHEVVKVWGERGLPVNTIRIKLAGSAGQSFGAFLSRGITLKLEGDSNDYVGKGLSGGRLIIYPPKEFSFCSVAFVLLCNLAALGSTMCM